MKSRLKNAQTGRNLLKRKSEALTVRFRQILNRILITKTLVGEVLREAAFSLAEAKFTMGEFFGQQIIQSVSQANLKVRSKKENVAGVKLIIMEAFRDGNSKYI
jgi:V-type H+-transporting ATPase subunit D